MRHIYSTKLLAFLAIILTFYSSNAQEYNLNTTLNTYWPAPNLNKPNYLQGVTDPTFDTKITRITGDPNSSIPNMAGESWKNISRHGYSTRQPWNADESVIFLGKHKDLNGSSGPDLFLDGQTYEVIKEADLPSGNEHRWDHNNPDLFLIIRDTEIISWNYKTEEEIQLISYSGYEDVDNGGTGNFTTDGTKVGVSAFRKSDNKLVTFTLDLVTKTKGVDIDISEIRTLGHVSISALGNYIIVTGSYASGADQTKVYDVNGNLVSYWPEYARPSHFDFAVDQNGDEVAVGVSKSDPNKGKLIKRRLSDGFVTEITTGGWPPHTSARALNRPGWVYASTSSSSNYGPYMLELIAVKLDGSRIERLGHTRNVLHEYLNEVHACPSPSGSRVIFASDWGADDVPIQAYVVDFRDKIIQEGLSAGANQNICEDDSVTLTASGAESYVWNTGETTASITVSPNTTTTYTVTGTQANGETSTDSVMVTVNEPPVANAGEDAIVCEDEEVTLTASGGSTYLWSNGETTQSITVNPASSTSYSVIATQNSCSSTDEVLVTVNPRQTINAGNDVDINLGESTTLTVIGVGNILWSTGETMASIVVSPTVNTTYTVDVTEQNGCTSTDEVRVSIIGNVNANAGADVSICEGENTILTASGGDDYLWNTGETTASITVNPTATTNYTVIVSNASTSDTDEVSVFVNAVPNVNAGDNKTIDLGEYVTLSATGADTYLWSNGATQPNIAVSPQNTTTYYVTGYVNNCSDESQVTVNVANAISANAGKDTIICIGDTHTLVASGGESYAWSTGETTQSINVSPSEDTIYTVTVSNQYASASDDVSVLVENCGGEEDEENSNDQFSVYPNPASEGVLNIQLFGLTNASSIYIHDTIGKLIYIETIDANNGQLIQKSINISNYTSGLYFVTLEEDYITTTKKIIFH